MNNVIMKISALWYTFPLFRFSIWDHEGTETLLMLEHEFLLHGSLQSGLLIREYLLK